MQLSNVEIVQPELPAWAGIPIRDGVGGIPLRDGVGGWRAKGGDAGPALLMDLDMREPTQQAFPTTATGVINGRTASYIWLCDEASGNLVDEVAGAELAPTNSPRQGRTAVGFYDGTNTYGKNCVELNDGTSQGFLASSNTVAEAGIDSIAVLFVFRTKPVSGTTNRNLFIKYDTDGSNSGYHANVQTVGTVTLTAYEHGTTQSQTVTVPASSGNHFDSAWHAGLFVIDRNAGTMAVYTDVGSVSEALTVGDISTIGSFSLGRITTSASPNAQIAYCAVFQGAQAEGLGQADLDTFWTHGSAPNLLDTYTRASLACPIVGSEAGFGVRVAKYGDGQFAHGYNSAFTHASKLGGLFERSVTNLVKDSELGTTANWATANGTVTAKAEESPDGTQTADLLTATAADCRHQAINLALTSGQLYTGSIFLKRGGAVDVSADLYLLETGIGIVGAVETVTLTSEWQRFDFAATPTATADHRLVLRLNNSGESAYVWGRQLEANDLSSYIPTTSAAATRAAASARMTNTAGRYLLGAQGEIEAVVAFFSDISSEPTRVFIDSGNATDNQGRHMMRIDDQSGSYPDSLIFSTTGVQVSNPIGVATPDFSVEHTFRTRWDADAALEGHAELHDIYVDGTRYAGTTTPWTPADPDNIYPGQNRVDTSWADGLVARIRSWAGPRADAP